MLLRKLQLPQPSRSWSFPSHLEAGASPKAVPKLELGNQRVAKIRTIEALRAQGKEILHRV